MPVAEGLFPAGPYEVAPAIGPEVSAQRRLTMRQRAAIAAGRHPLLVTFRRWGFAEMQTRLHPEAPADADSSWRGEARPFTCGSCWYRRQVYWSASGYAKCFFGDGVRVSHSAATDVRSWWPACLDYSAGDPSLGPDAARMPPADEPERKDQEDTPR